MEESLNKEVQLYEAGRNAFLKLKEAGNRTLHYKSSIDHHLIKDLSLTQLIARETKPPLHFLEDCKGIRLGSVRFIDANDSLYAKYLGCSSKIPAEFSFLFNAIVLQPDILKKFPDREIQSIICHELTHSYHYNFLFPFLLAEMNYGHLRQDRDWQQEFWLLSDAEAYRMAYHFRYDLELGGKEHARGRLADAMVMHSIFGSHNKNRYEIRTYLEQLLILEERGKPKEEELVDLRLCFPWEQHFLDKMERYKQAIKQ